MQNYIFSIIIPHYNTPELLMRCLASIPVRDDIQVLVIDDCSPNSDDYLDRFPELCRPYLEYYKTPKGGSAGRARNIGLDHAKGKWVICMDADDLFVDNMEAILEKIKGRNEDVIFFNFKSVLNDDLTKEGNRKGYQRFFEAYKEQKNDYEFRYCFDSMWGKVFSHQLILNHKIKFDETRYGNDVAFSYKCGFYAKTVAVIDEPFFIITEREGTLASSQFSKKKTAAEEYRVRLRVFLDIRRFTDKENSKVNYQMHMTYSHLFYQARPLDFMKYFGLVIIPHYFKYSFEIAAYIVYASIFRK